MGNKFAKELGLVFKLREEIYKQYMEWGINLEASNGNSDRELPMPATIITNTEGVVIHVFTDTDYTKRIEPEEILEVLKNK